MANKQTKQYLESELENVRSLILTTNEELEELKIREESLFKELYPGGAG